MFKEVYVSSDSNEILKLAKKAGAITIKRGENLCGETPDIEVFLHAYKHFRNKKDVLGMVAVHANNPTMDKARIYQAMRLIELGTPEVMSCYPMSKDKRYHKRHNRINGSIRGMSIERLKHYGDPYTPNPEVLIVDDSVEIETPKSFKAARKQHDNNVSRHN